MNEIIDRFIQLVELEHIKMPWLERQTGIKQDRWHSIKKRKVMRTSELEAMYKICPEYQIWLATGFEVPELGQISPMTKDAQNNK